MSSIPYLWPWSNYFKGEKLLIIKIWRFQDDVCPLSFVPLLCCLQWHIKPLLRQISDETASTNNNISIYIYRYIYITGPIVTKEYKWINFGTPQEASLEGQRSAKCPRTAMLDCMQNYNVSNKNFRALHP